MSNIVGEGFAREIREQVNKRQEIYGSINRSNEQLQYLNANTGWVRLASSVDVNTQIRDFPANLKSNNLAKQYVLFGGIQGVQGTNFNNLYNNAFNTEAYGIGGTEFGIRPMPGIKSAQIKTLTRGSLKEATVQITANNRTQFDIIDILYLRLGFTMLLEWGHASYFPNTGDFVENNPFGIYTGFLEGFYSYNDVLDIIQDSRIKSNGNYDAIAGKVVNFTWKYNRDGSYSITLILRSLGDVIESLKANILLGDGEATLATPENTEGVYSSDTGSNNTLNLLKGTPFDLSKKKEKANRGYIYKQSEPTNQAPATSYSNSIEKLTLQLKQVINASRLVANSGIKLPDFGTSPFTIDYFGQTYKGESPIQYYIRLGYFLDWIQNNIIPKVKNTEKIIKIDTNIEDNIILLHADQISADPNVCTFKKTIQVEPEGDEITFSSGVETFIVDDKNTTFEYGKIMNAYFNMDWINNTIKSLISTDTGDVSVLKLLRALCDGWNKATGHYNRLDIQIDPDTNEAKFIDEVAIPSNDRLKFLKNKNTAYFLTYRSLPGTGSTFIKDVDFTTQIPHNFATLITIGSTAQGYVLGADATALSRMNAGLTDRIKPEINSPGRENLSLFEKYKESILAYNEFITNLGIIDNEAGTSIPTWNSTAIARYSSLQPQFLEYTQASQSRSDQTQQASSPNIGFLPFNLSLTMDGLSGMKVYQKFEVDTDFLPSNYPKSLEFIVKGITHTIQNNEWITNIESIAIPKNPFGYNIKNKRKIDKNKLKYPSYTGPVSPSNLQPLDEKIKIAINFFKNKGITNKLAISAIIGNLIHESQLNTTIIGDNNLTDTAIGIAQWRLNRRRNLEAKGNWTDYNVQLNFIWEELTKLFLTNVLEPLQNSTLRPSNIREFAFQNPQTIEYFVELWDRNYEISANRNFPNKYDSKSAQQRIAEAKNILARYDLSLSSTATKITEYKPTPEQQQLFNRNNVNPNQGTIRQGGILGDNRTAKVGRNFPGLKK